MGRWFSCFDSRELTRAGGAGQVSCAFGDGSVCPEFRIYAAGKPPEGGTPNFKMTHCRAFIGVENPRRFFHCSRVHRLLFITALSAGLAVLIGCGKPVPVATPPLTLDDFLPKHAQPKLSTLKIYLGAETLDAELALTKVQEMTGMMFRTNIAETDAMLFVFPTPHQAAFWMKNCPESLSAAYIDPAGVVAEIRHLEKNNTNSVVAASDNIQYILEVKEGWFTRHGISAGTVIRTERGSLAETFFGKN